MLCRAVHRPAEWNTLRYVLSSHHGGFHYSFMQTACFIIKFKPAAFAWLIFVCNPKSDTVGTLFKSRNWNRTQEVANLILTRISLLMEQNQKSFKWRIWCQFFWERGVVGGVKKRSAVWVFERECCLFLSDSRFNSPGSLQDFLCAVMRQMFSAGERSGLQAAQLSDYDVSIMLLK